MASISAMVDSILSRSCAFSTLSARSRSSVRGVRRSCEMDASKRVRFSIRLRRRLCMSLKARAACRVSMVPVSASGGALTSWPSRSAAVASEARGAVTRRTAHTDTPRMMIAMTPMESRNRDENAGPPVGRARRKREPPTIRQGNRDLQIPEPGEAAEAVHHGAMPHHVPGAERGTIRRRRRHTWLARRSEGQAIDQECRDRLRNGCVAICDRNGGRLGRKRDAEALIVRARRQYVAETSRGVSWTRRVRLAMRWAVANPPTARTACSRSAV